MIWSSQLAEPAEPPTRPHRHARLAPRCHLQGRAVELQPRRIPTATTATTARQPWHPRASRSTFGTSTWRIAPSIVNGSGANDGGNSSGHSGRFGHEFLGRDEACQTRIRRGADHVIAAEFDFRVVGDGRSAITRYANNSNYRNDSLIRKESTFPSNRRCQ